MPHPLKPRKTTRLEDVSAADLYCEVQQARLALVQSIDRLKIAPPDERRHILRRVVALYARLKRANDLADLQLEGRRPGAPDGFR